MARLYAVMTDLCRIGDHFGISESRDLEVPTEMVEGQRGLVVIKRGGQRALKSIGWGFPRHTYESRSRGGDPERIGLVANLTNPMWDRIAVDPRYRCIVVLTHFANPAGVEGKKTRTWFSAADGSVMAWAGLCRMTEEFGPVYAGLTQDANELIFPFNERMPVLLRPDEYDTWLSGTIEDVIRFQFREPPPPAQFSLRSTKDRWRSGIPPKRGFHDQQSMVI